ncbi:MAG: ACP S-malonyltransferase [Streptomyces sp.]|nr:ACP S-malonyltransferase [Streptomyces sp.]
MGIGVMFPGQGSQVPGMGQDLYYEDEEVRRLYDTAGDILGYDLLRACEDRHGELSDTAVVQPAVVVHSVACWRLLCRALPEPPAVMAGHSLGEISALVCAGALDFEAAVALAQRRGRLMAECPPGTMAVVFGLHADEVERVLAASVDGRVVVANRNSREQCVISGEADAFAAAGTALSARGAVVRPLRVTVAPHSPLMRAAVAGFTELVTQAGIGDADIPIVSSCDGTVLRGAVELSDSLCNQLTGCVDWPRTVRLMVGHQVDTLVEVGPKAVLRDLSKSEFPDRTVWACDSVRGIRSVSMALAESDPIRPATVGTTELVAFLLAGLRLAVGTPDDVGLSGEEYESAVRAPYTRLLERLDLVRAARISDPEELLESAIRDIAMLLRAKGFSALQSHAALDRALAVAGTAVRSSTSALGLEAASDGG